MFNVLRSQPNSTGIAIPVLSCPRTPGRDMHTEHHEFITGNAQYRRTAIAADRIAFVQQQPVRARLVIDLAPLIEGQNMRLVAASQPADIRAP